MDEKNIKDYEFDSVCNDGHESILWLKSEHSDDICPLCKWKTKHDEVKDMYDDAERDLESANDKVQELEDDIEVLQNKVDDLEDIINPFTQHVHSVADQLLLDDVLNKFKDSVRYGL